MIVAEPRVNLLAGPFIRWMLQKTGHYLRAKSAFLIPWQMVPRGT